MIHSCGAKSLFALSCGPRALREEQHLTNTTGEHSKKSVHFVSYSSTVPRGDFQIQVAGWSLARSTVPVRFYGDCRTPKRHPAHSIAIDDSPGASVWSSNPEQMNTDSSNTEDNLREELPRILPVYGRLQNSGGWMDLRSGESPHAGGMDRKLDAGMVGMRRLRAGGRGGWLHWAAAPPRCWNGAGSERRRSRR